ncbi:MAG: hypothetical protein G5Z42_02925 [Caldisphaeraceae archaeon]|nr:hypothetical protein [Caldisphaeraceae archaeon]MEB3797759.1 hypothetical protein [Caldisphaeraceae archaeon]
MKGLGVICGKKECRAVEQVINIVRAERGGYPSFDCYHVVEALRLIKGRGVGRPYLSYILGIGDASAKTLIKRLREFGLVKQVGRHSYISDLGEMVVEGFEESMHIYSSKLSIEGFEECNVLFLKMKPPKDLTSIHMLRDVIISKGCEESIVGFVDNGVIGFPGLPRRLEKMVSTPLLMFGSVIKQGAVIVVPSKCMKVLYSFFISVMKDCCSENQIDERQ